MLKGYFDVPNMVFFNAGNIWTGSLYTNFSYRIIPRKRSEEEGGNELYCCVWYGTASYDNVKSFEAEHSEELSQEGLDRCLEWLTDQVEKFKQDRKDLGF